MLGPYPGVAKAGLDILAHGRPAVRKLKSYRSADAAGRQGRGGKLRAGYWL